MSLANIQAAGRQIRWPLRREPAMLVLLALALVLALLAGLAIGSLAIPPASWLGLLTGEPDRLGLIALTIRLPRVLLAGIVGAGLALAGAAMQALFRNPLADPGLTGSASGAVLAVVALITLGHREAWSFTGMFGSLGLSFAAMAASGLTTILVYGLARGREGQLSIGNLLLAGIGVNALASAAIGLFVTIADDNQLRSIQFWMLGSLSGTAWSAVFAALPIVLVAGIILWRCAAALDLFTLGETQAFVSGVDTVRLKGLVVLAAAGATGAAVAFTGLVGFVGLLGPHCARLICGQRYAFVLPGSLLIGAIVVILADVLARIAIAPAELPIGLVTSLVGAPFFIALMRRAVRS